MADEDELQNKARQKPLTPETDQEFQHSTEPVMLDGSQREKQNGDQRKEQNIESFVKLETLLNTFLKYSV